MAYHSMMRCSVGLFSAFPPPPFFNPVPPNDDEHKIHTSVLCSRRCFRNFVGLDGVGRDMSRKDDLLPR